MVVNQLRPRGGMQTAFGLDTGQLCQCGLYGRFAANDENMIRVPFAPDMDVTAAQLRQGCLSLITRQRAIGVGDQPVEDGTAGQFRRGIAADMINQAAESRLRRVRLSPAKIQQEQLQFVLQDALTV